MKYRPSLPEHNDNVSHQKPLREFFLILAGVLTVTLALFWVAGLAIDAVVDRLSPEAEARIHRALAAGMTEQKHEAPALQAELERMTEELRHCAGIAYPVSLQLVQSEEPNAAVLPGGHIVVFSGLLDKVGSRNGLSFVLAHELSHLKHRDHLRGLGRQLLLITLSVALTGAQSELTQILVPANQLGMARHSQTREMAADGNALAILQCHYGHVGGADEFFRALQEQEGERAIGVSHYFASHPELHARLANLASLRQEHGYKAGVVLPLELPAVAR